MDALDEERSQDQRAILTRRIYAELLRCYPFANPSLNARQLDQVIEELLRKLTAVKRPHQVLVDETPFLARRSTSSNAFAGDADEEEKLESPPKRLRVHCEETPFIPLDRDGPARATFPRYVQSTPRPLHSQAKVPWNDPNMRTPFPEGFPIGTQTPPNDSSGVRWNLFDCEEPGIRPCATSKVSKCYEDGTASPEGSSTTELGEEGKTQREQHALQISLEQKLHRKVVVQRPFAVSRLLFASSAPYLVVEDQDSVTVYAVACLPGPDAELSEVSSLSKVLVEMLPLLSHTS